MNRQEGTVEMRRRAGRLVALVTGVNQAVAALIASVLSDEGYRAAIVPDLGERGWPASTPHLVVAPLPADAEQARALCGRIKGRVPPPLLVLLADCAVHAQANRAMLWGADAVVPNPFVVSAFREALVRARQRSGGRAADTGTRLEAIAGSHPVLRDYLRGLQAVAVSDLPVLLVGEHGTAKSVWAAALHQSSLRARGPYIAATCARSNGDDPVAAVFGLAGDSEAGAIGRVGAALQADLGTLFLRRLHQASDEFLAQLECLVAEQRVQAVGAGSSARVDLRVIATAARDPRGLREFPARVAERLGAVTLYLPPLRARLADIRPLAEHFLALHAAALNRPVPRLAASAVAVLERHRWPGNFHEFETCLRRALLLAPGGTIADTVIAPLLAPSRAAGPATAPLAAAGGARR